MKNKKGSKKGIILLAIALALFASLIYSAAAQPTGATVNFQFNSTKNSTTPSGRNDTKGTINTVLLNTEQQNSKWKAYVGNISSTFVLDDSGDFSIYQWTIETFSGEIFVTRNNSVIWNNIANASETNKTAEDTFLNHNSISPDSINRTFSRRVHRSFTVGSTTINENSSYSTVTWQRDRDHALNVSAPWQEVLLTDGLHLIYTVFVENDLQGYQNTTTYDFQAIVPDDAQGASPAVTYYFYMELS